MPSSSSLGGSSAQPDASPSPMTHPHDIHVSNFARLPTLEKRTRPVSLLAVAGELSQDSLHGHGALRAPGNRRHSTNMSVNRPLRSSPLAGPAFSTHPPLIEADDESESKELKLSTSTPNLKALLAKRGTGPERRRPASSGASPSGFSTQLADDSIRRTMRQRTVSRTGQPHPSIPPVPFRAIQDRSPVSPQDGLLKASSQPAMVRKRVNTNPSLPHSMLPSPSDEVPKIHSSDPAHNWLTSNMYETTPQFSRLGLGASNVVLPVSAKEYRRRSRNPSRKNMGSRGSIISTSPSIETSQRNSIQSSPSLSTTACSSASSSRETLTYSYSSPGLVLSVSETGVIQDEKSASKRASFSFPISRPLKHVSQEVRLSSIVATGAAKVHINDKKNDRVLVQDVTVKTESVSSSSLEEEKKALKRRSTLSKVWRKITNFARS